MNEELLERLEMKIAYLERANHELSDVVYRHQQELNELRLRLVNMLSRFDTLASQRPYTDEEERPPHY